MRKIKPRIIPLTVQLDLAGTFWRRLKGLLATENLQKNQGLLIRPCSCVHTFGMRYPIDIAFLAADGLVLQTVSAFPPGRLRFEPAACQVLELAAGELDRLEIRPHDRLLLPGQVQDGTPGSVDFVTGSEQGDSGNAAQ